MARVNSQDLRGRVIDMALAGTPARHAAAHFGIAVATLIRWADETGDRRARRQGPQRRSRLDPVTRRCWSWWRQRQI